MIEPKSGSVELNEEQLQSLKQEMPKSGNALIGKMIKRA